MYEEKYKKDIQSITVNDFARAFQDNSDQSDVQLVADYLRKLELNENVIHAIVSLMYEHQSNWTKQHQELINWLNIDDSQKNDN